MAGDNLKLPGREEAERLKTESHGCNQVNGTKDQVQDVKPQRLTGSCPRGLELGLHL